MADGSCKNMKRSNVFKLVQGTNDRATLSKNSMVSSGYFHDDFVKYFVTNNARRAPIINRGYFVRAFGVNHMVRTFLRSFQTKTQILSLGAGFDSTFFRLKSEGLLEKTHYYEVDFPKVVQDKLKMIEHQDILSAVGEVKSSDQKANEALILQTERYKLLGCDLKDTPNLERSLLESGVDQHCPTLLISEVVLTYMDPTSSDAVIGWAARFFSSAVFLMYEQMYPMDSFGIVMTNHFKDCGAPILGTQTYPTPEKQKQRFKKQGWPDVSVVDMNQIYRSTVPQEEKLRIGTLEPFDEFEEWHVKCSHYMILTAFKGCCAKLQDQFHTGTTEAVTDRMTVRKCLQYNQVDVFPSSMKLQRFGHSATVSADGNMILLIGGFGQNNGKHMRLEDVQLLTCESGDWRCHEVTPAAAPLQPGPRMFHSTTAVSNERFLVFGGRTSPLKPCASCQLVKVNRTVGCGYPVSSSGESTRSSNTVERASEAECCSSEGFAYSCEAVPICCADGPDPRWRHTATRITVPPGDREQVLVMGGRSPAVAAFGDGFVFDVSSQTWAQVQFCGEQVEPRHSHSACAWNHYVVLAGGLGPNLEPLSSVQMIDTRTRPMKVETLNIQPPLEPRYSHTAYVSRDTLVLLGGVNPTSPHSPGLQLVDLKSRDLVSYSLPVRAPDCRPVMLHNHCSVCLEDQIFVLGGGGNCFSFGTHLNGAVLSVDLPPDHTS